jgi:hypothetical protein
MLPPPAANADELNLLPPDCTSRAEAEQRRRLPIKLPQRPPAPRPKLQFSIRELFIVMMAVSVSLAGGNWMPADIFAAVLGLATLAGLFVVTWNPPETRVGKLMWAILIIAYLIAVITAAFRSQTL